MAFTEIEKTRRGWTKGAPATFAINKKGSGNLRINRAGMDFIAAPAPGLKMGDMEKSELSILVAIKVADLT